MMATSAPDMLRSSRLVSGYSWSVTTARIGTWKFVDILTIIVKFSVVLL